MIPWEQGASIKMRESPRPADEMRRLGFSCGYPVVPAAVTRETRALGVPPVRAGPRRWRALREHGILAAAIPLSGLSLTVPRRDRRRGAVHAYIRGHSCAVGSSHGEYKHIEETQLWGARPGWCAGRQHEAQLSNSIQMESIKEGVRVYTLDKTALSKKTSS